jgi:glycosyltransferase involved in cell wall biosynthesis
MRATEVLMPATLDLSLVVPAHDEVDNLERVVTEVQAALDPTGLRWELVIVDDGSTDGSTLLLERLAAIEPRLRIVNFARQRGQTAALRAGFDVATGRLIATMDADLQCPPSELPLLLDALGDADMACGIRTGRHDPASRKIASTMANGVRRLFLAPRIRDLAGPLRVFRRDALARVTSRWPLFDGAHRWLPALFDLAGLRVVQRPVVHRPRTAGRSNYTTRGRLLPIGRELIQVLHLRAALR